LGNERRRVASEKCVSDGASESRVEGGMEVKTRYCANVIQQIKHFFRVSWTRGGEEAKTLGDQLNRLLSISDPLDQMDRGLHATKRTPISIRVRVLPHSFQAVPFSHNRPEF